LSPLGFFGGGQGKSNWTDFDAVASALGLTPVELFQNLHNGKSLTGIATAQGEDIAAVQQAAQAAQTQAVKDAIDQAVKDGRITQDQANWMQHGIDKGWSHGFGGPGMDGRGFGGHRGGLYGNQQAAPGTQPNAQPSATPSM
jgi:hypothetical protein